jgi:hypothetical protein
MAIVAPGRGDEILAVLNLRVDRHTLAAKKLSVRRLRPQSPERLTFSRLSAPCAVVDVAASMFDERRRIRLMMSIILLFCDAAELFCANVHSMRN